MSSSLATTSTTGSGLHHHRADGSRPHATFSSDSMSYKSLGIGGSSSPSFPPPLRSRSPALSSSARKAPTPHGPRGLRPKDSRTMAAVRPKLAVLPCSGAVDARSMTDSPAPDFLDMRSPESPAVSVFSKAKAGSVPQPNVKKMRRRVALLTGVHLNLPHSPVVGPSPPGSSRAWTFTAEWDSAQDEFVFSELESSSSGSLSGGLSLTPASARFFSNPIPFDVSEDDVTSSPLAKLSIASRLQELASASSSSSASSSWSCSPTSPAVSDIFDLYTARTPSTHSFFPDSDSNDSSSTAPSSPVDTPSPSRLSPGASLSSPSYEDGRFQPPVIQVTFYEDARQGKMDRALPTPASAFEPISWEPLFHEKFAELARAPHSAGVPRSRRPRPLPPVPVRGKSSF
ncbi:hypothetical protein C8Q80DRAFT_513497 [Daedaleopsis nitida]|nr:hypothetical protein C8Q80DRAFT_513497 [Daedaleopsis nitida]